MIEEKVKKISQMGDFIEVIKKERQSILSNIDTLIKERNAAVLKIRRDRKLLKLLDKSIVLFDDGNNGNKKPPATKEVTTKPVSISNSKISPERNELMQDVIRVIKTTGNFLKMEDIKNSIGYEKTEPPFWQILADIKNYLNRHESLPHIKCYRINGSNKSAYWGLLEWFDEDGKPKKKYLSHQMWSILSVPVANK